VLVRLESRRWRAVVLVLVLAGAAWMARMVVSPAIADHLVGRAATATDLERTVAWDPGNPDLRLRLADAYRSAIEGADADKARVHAETALHHRPTHAGTWLRLAYLADREGKPERAHQAIETAVRYDRHSVGLRWEAALLTLRWGDRDAALDHLRYVLAVDPERRDVAFQLARSLLGPGESAASLLPEEPDALIGLLSLAVGDRDLDLARAAWERRARIEPPVPASLQRGYFELLLEKGEGPAARRLWLAMTPGGVPAESGNAVWNGSFENDRLLGWGFDWQVQRVWGVETRLDRFAAARGRQSLRLSFNSFPTLDFAGVSHLVTVEPGREYRLRALVKAQDFVTRSGLKLQVVKTDGQQVLAETDAVTGTTIDWTPLEAVVRIPPDVSLVRLRLRREKSPAPEGNLGGRVWVDEVSLTPAAAAADL
jgi:tetratricopeptide (TPR) repeat protein